MVDQNSDKLKVFISWSGNQSCALAKGLRDWLPLVLHYVNPWLSEVDIAAGQRWAEEVGSHLESTNFGLICVTPENLSSQWVHFEAGALAKSMSSSRLVPLLLDMEIRNLSGPLALFQAKKVSKQGIWETVTSINQVSDSRIPDERLQKYFDAFWPELESRLKSIPSSTVAVQPNRNNDEILEDLVKSVRSVEAAMKGIDQTTASTLNKLSRLENPQLLNPQLDPPNSPAPETRFSLFGSQLDEIGLGIIELNRRSTKKDAASQLPELRSDLSNLRRSLGSMHFFPLADSDRRRLAVMISTLNRVEERLMTLVHTSENLSDKPE